MDLIGEDNATPETETVDTEETTETESKVEVVEEEAAESAPEEEIDDESGLEAPDDSEIEQEENVVEESEKLDDKFIDTATFLTDYFKKISNAKNVPVKGIPTIPSGKYLLFVTDADEDADMILIDTPNRLAFEKFDPENIVVEKSGIVAINNTCRTYVTKTNVIQYKVDDVGSPTSVTIFKKIGVNSANPKFETKDTESDTKSVAEIKLHIASVSTPLAKKVKELSTVDEIRKETVEFLGTIVDVNYLIKINNMMMKVGL